MAKERPLFMRIAMTAVLVAISVLAIKQPSASASYRNRIVPTSNPTVTIPTGPFDPASYGVPDSIAGYKVLAVISANNTACVGPDDKRLVLLTDEPTVMDTVNKSQIDAVNVEAARLGLTDYTKGGIQWAGPGTTTQQVVAGLQEWNKAIAAAGSCLQTGPIPVPVQATPTSQ